MRHLLHDVTHWLQKHFIAIEFVTWALAFAVVAYSGLQYYTLTQEYAAAKQELASSTEAYHRITQNLREKFAVVVNRNQSLSDSLSAEQTKNTEFQAQLNGVKGAVDQLTVLAKTDKELLQKYSKVYFLSENYEPATTTLIASKYLSDPKAEQRFLGQAYSFLTKMLDAASDSGLSIKVLSGYRSFGYQSSLKTEYKTTFGTGANAFSADQGYSEHQLGTALDVTTPKMGASLTIDFAATDAYKWLTDNAYKYGFILSYPKGNSYYIYEPWHWRFVGTALATRLHSEGKNFYDLDQRDIDGYLALMFN